MSVDGADLQLNMDHAASAALGYNPDRTIQSLSNQSFQTKPRDLDYSSFSNRAHFQGHNLPLSKSHEKVTPRNGDS